MKDVAGLLNISEKTVYRWIDERKLPGYRLNGQYRFNRAELLEWSTANRINVSPRIFEEPESQAGPLPELSDALERGGIFYRIAGADKPSVLRNVVEMLRLPDSVDREFLLQVLLAREALESTAIGDGIAIPHVRNPIVLHVPEPTMTLCFLEKPVDFGAVDGQPVHTLFTFISPTVKAHLHLLSRLAFALRNPDFKKLVIQQAGRDDILAAAKKISATLRMPKADPNNEPAAESKEEPK
ncbi:MAG TPA: PTS sugar transporter subunit IIA [Verrucomicrobiae bacterium]|nr:PTS sugar transporter subunit IIA [Verrucomicrobiae bacterium]